jgi:hypothetical protein
MSLGKSEGVETPWNVGLDWGPAQQRGCASRGYTLPVSSSPSDGFHRIRVTGPDGDPRSIRVAGR